MAESVIGPSIQIEGDITGSDALTVLGTVRGGRISVKEALTVAASGRIECDVESSAVDISGVIQGNVAATDKVELKSGGKLIGDVKAPRILIADGASFKGNINMGG
jgi:cytoskeletal protein CcmA (bactofilin family)